MEGILRYLRLRMAVVVALVAVGLVSMAMSASASPNPFVKDISLGIRNSSNAPIRVFVCVNALTIPYQDGLSPDPCGTITHTYIIFPGDRAIIPNANPVGVIMTHYDPKRYFPESKRTLYFSARNQPFERPYFRAQGHKVPLSEGEAVLRQVDGVDFELRRYQDDVRNGEIVKVMRIEIRSWPGCAGFHLCFI